MINQNGILKNIQVTYEKAMKREKQNQKEKNRNKTKWHIKALFPFTCHLQFLS